MRSDESNPNNFVTIVDLNYQSVGIAFNVKYYSIILEEASSWVVRFYIAWTFPKRLPQPLYTMTLTVLRSSYALPKNYEVYA